MPYSSAPQLGTRSLLPGDALERFHLNHFFIYTIEDLNALPRSTLLWTQVFPSYAQRASCIRHAAIALGATHWLFLTCATQTTHLLRFAADQYYEAIKAVIPLMSGRDAMGIEHVLLCCLLFVLLESLRGNQAEALRHLEAGYRLFTEQSGDTVESPDNVIGCLFATFQRLGTEASLFAEKRLLPDTPTPWTQSRHKRCQTSHQSSRSFSLGGILDDLSELYGVYNCLSWRLDMGLTGKAWPTPERAHFEEQIRMWRSNVRLTIADLPNDSTSIMNQQLIVFLDLQHRTLDAVLRDIINPGELLSPDECHQMLDQVETLLALVPARPTFSIRSYIVPSLIFLYGYCLNFQIRQRVIHLLRRHRRHEVVWNSEAVAQFFENDLNNRLMGLCPPDWPDIGPSSNNENALLVFRPREDGFLSTMGS